MAEDTTKKIKLATAVKRNKQDAKKRIRNRATKSRIHTARIALKKAADDSEEKSEHLSSLHSLIDKAVKKGLFKKNKANRLKSRLNAQI